MNRLTKYLNATAAEMKHVKWPSRHQAVVYTVLVIAISAFISLFTGGFDFLFSNLLNLIINHG